MGTYIASSGEKFTQKQIDYKIRAAKGQKIVNFIDEHGYIFCEDCGHRNKPPYDCSHEVSVDRCKKTGQVEKAWDVDNIKIRCRECHQKHDKLFIEPNKIK